MLDLRLFTTDDIPLLLGWAGDGDERELLLWAGPSFSFPLDEAQLVTFLETKQRSNFYIIEEDGSAVGIIELGNINREHRNARIQKVFIGERRARGKGLATQAVKKLVEYCSDELHFHKVTLGVLAGNRNAYRCYVGLGFEVEGIQKECRLFGGVWYDLYDMAIFPSKGGIRDSRVPVFSKETERLVIRTAVPADAPAAADYYRRNREFLSTFGPPRPEEFFTPEAQLDMILQETLLERQSKGLRLWIEKKGDPGRFIGNMSISNVVRGFFQSAFLGYQLDAQEVRKGYISEAVPVMIEQGFTRLGLHRIEANIMPGNEASLATIKKLGFQYEGEAPDYLYIRDSWENHQHFSLTNRNYRK